MEADALEVDMNINGYGTSKKERNIRLILEGRLMEAKKVVFSQGILDMLENGEFILASVHVAFKLLISVYGLGEDHAHVGRYARRLA